VKLRFINDERGEDHFKRHGPLLGLATREEYMLAAEKLMLGPSRPGVLEFLRAQGDIARFDTTAEEFGVIGPDKVTLRTYYLPVPGVSHKQTTNLDYFNAQQLRKF